MTKLVVFEGLSDQYKDQYKVSFLSSHLSGFTQT
jgi:hypothetical protein